MWLGEEKYNTALKRLEKYDKGSLSDKPRQTLSKFPGIPSFIPASSNNDNSGINPDFFNINDKKLFSVLIDFDCITDTHEIYGKTWAIHYLSFINTIYQDNNRLMHIEVGESYTIGISNEFKVYTWGMNDLLQLGRIAKSKKATHDPALSMNLSAITPKMISCGSDHGVALDLEGNAYAWGSNLRGELGIGNERMTPSIVK